MWFNLCFSLFHLNRRRKRNWNKFK